MAWKLKEGGGTTTLIARGKKFRGAIAGWGAALSCCCVLLIAAGCVVDPGSSRVNRKNYDRIKEGMTYGEVAAMFDGPGHLMMEVTLAGRTTKYYEWVGLDNYTVSVSFTNGVVSDKSSWGSGGRKSEEPVKIYFEKGPEVTERREPPAASGVTFANFEKVKNGMTYAEVAATFGGEGKAKGSRWVGATELKEYEWRNPGGGYATVNFTRGRVCRKYQRGLK